MAVKSGKKRVVITVSEQLLEKLDAYCTETGISRSSYISTVIANQFYAQQQMMEKLTEALGKAAEQVEG